MDLSPNVSEAITTAATQAGLDPALMLRIATIVSGGNPNAKKGSYQGLCQLSDDEFKKYGGGDIYNTVDNANAAARKIAAESNRFQAQYGRTPTPTDIYLIHNQGPAGYAAHLANPDSPAWQNMAGTGEGKKKGDDWAHETIAGNYYGPGDPSKLTSGQ